MPTVSDYIIVTDEETRLQSGGTRDRTFTFSVPPNVDTSQRAVAIWQFEAEGLQQEAPPQNLTWNLHVNGKQLVEFTHHLNRFNALQEVLPGSVLHAGGSNHATVRIIGGQGVIKFSAFVIHIQVNAGSAPVGGSTGTVGGSTGTGDGSTGTGDG